MYLSLLPAYLNYFTIPPALKIALKTKNLHSMQGAIGMQVF